MEVEGYGILLFTINYYLSYLFVVNSTQPILLCFCLFPDFFIQIHETF